MMERGGVLPTHAGSQWQVRTVVRKKSIGFQQSVSIMVSTGIEVAKIRLPTQLPRKVASKVAKKSDEIWLLRQCPIARFLQGSRTSNVKVRSRGGGSGVTITSSPEAFLGSASRFR